MVPLFYTDYDVFVLECLTNVFNICKNSINYIALYTHVNLNYFNYLFTKS